MLLVRSSLLKSVACGLLLLLLILLTSSSLHVQCNSHNFQMSNFSQQLGFDLSSAYDLVIPKHGKAIVKTDLAISIPENTYARVGK